VLLTRLAKSVVPAVLSGDELELWPSGQSSLRGVENSTIPSENASRPGSRSIRSVFCREDHRADARLARARAAKSAGVERVTASWHMSPTKPRRSGAFVV
jgi:hypothetical protein